MAKTAPKNREFPKTGIATARDVADFFRISIRQAYRLLELGTITAIDITEGTVRTTWEILHEHVRQRQRSVPKQRARTRVEGSC